MENIKLVIWDLDETFWKGTLAENDDIIFIQKNIDLVKKLTDHGIMNSIVSKNDYQKAKDKLIEAEVFEYFIFPQISNASKGGKVKKILKIANLRAANTLFIDDNLSNLQEVQFYNDGINAVTPEFLKLDILSMPEFMGKDDRVHSRLKQYKLLEKRSVALEEYDSNEEFLRSSNIHISFGDDWERNGARVYELLQRTNQLNYTKKRISHKEFENIIFDSSIEKRYVSVRDNFGEYGIVGFYAVKEQRLLHFLFSCRILGMGIENYVYNKLNRPNVVIDGEVATPLIYNDINWIIEESEYQNKYDMFISDVKKNLLMVAGCDLEQACIYFGEGDYRITKEFATVRKNTEIRTSYSTQLVNALKLSKDLKKELCEKIPFFHEDITFATEIFNGKYDVIVWSVVDDYISGMYKAKKADYSINYGSYYEYNNYLEYFRKKELSYFFNNFIFVGELDVLEFKNNLEMIIEAINSDQILVLINGTDMDLSDWTGTFLYERYLEMNSIVDEVVSVHENVFLLDMRKILINRSDFVKGSNRHYAREVYYNMAKELENILRENKLGITMEIINEIEAKQIIKKQKIGDSVNKIKKCVKEIIGRD